MNHRVLSHGRPGAAAPGPRALLCSPALFSWVCSGSNSWLRPALLACLMLMGFFTPRATAQSWNNTGSLTGARIAHTATLLGNGQVLVTGGAQGNPISSCELYNPATGTWSATGSMATARQQHTATLLSDGKVLVTGGNPPSFNPTSSCEIYDPATGTWSPTASMAAARYYHMATLLSNGKVLVTGGYSSSPLNSCELFDPATNTWSPTGSMATARYVHTETLLNNGRVMVTGGYSSSPLNSCEIYDPATGTWSPTASMTDARVDHRVALLSNGKVLVTGGFSGSPLSSCELFDPATNTWSPTGSLAGGRYVHTATLQSNGKVMVVGGYNTSSSLNSCEIYDPATGTWSNTASLAAARYYHTTTRLGNGKVLVAGGTQGGGSLNSSELYTSANTAPVLTNTGLTLNERTSATVSTSNLNATDVDDDTLTFTLTSVPAQGTLKLNNVDLAQNDTFTPADIAGGQLTYTHTGAGSDSFGFSLSDGFSSTSGTFNITVTPVPPTVVSSTLLDASPTNAASVRFTVTFSEAVTGVDTGDFGPFAFGLTGTSVTGVTGSGSTYTVTVNTGNGQGMLNLVVTDNDSILDGTGNPLGGVGIGNGSYSSGQIYDVDHVAPTVTINQAAGQSDPTTVGSVQFTVAFNESVTGFTNSDVSLSGTSDVNNATVQVSGSGTTYTVTVSGLTKAGTVIATIGAGVATDGVGNLNTASTSTDNSVTFGHAPTALSLSRSSVQEKLPVGSFVGLLSSTDSDAGDSFTYSLVGGDTSAFAIDGAFLRTNAVFDEAVKNSYAITIRTTDSQGLTFDQPFAISVIETTKPSVGISNPTLGQKVLINGLTSGVINGTASDNKGVVAVKVRLSRKRGTANDYWNGSAWVATQFFLNATVTTVGDASVTWALNSGLPAANLLDSGPYALQVYALDGANNKSDYANTSFTILSDVTPPTLTLSTPTANQKLLISEFNGSAVSGTIADDMGSPRVKVRLSRKRGTANEYWNGTAWMAASSVVDGTVTGTTWSLGAATPPADKLDSGLYQVEAYAVDSGNNKSATAKVSFTLGTDFVAPTVAISTPTPSQVIKINEFGVGTLSGTASDNLGVTSVQLKLQRKRGTVTEYWNGTAFTATVATFAATYNAGTWSYDTAIPATALDAGGYSLYATALDAAGNKTTTASRSFSVVGTASAPDAVSVQGASSANGS